MSEGTWEKLSQVAVKGAEHDSRERHPHPKCLAGTRVALLDYIYGLLDKKDKNQIIWLHGTAGVGKSAVAFTVAQRMKSLKVTEQTQIETRLAGTFFFSRKHTKRRTTGYFFATLAYQLASNFPSVRTHVNSAILENPALLDPDKSVRDQMEGLFLRPLRKLQIRLRECGNPPLAFIVDALDECTSETLDQPTFESLDEDKSESELAELISLLARALRDPELPVIHILVTSRSEGHIREIMQNEDVRPLVGEIPVNISGKGVATTISLDGADVDEDIYRFLDDSFLKLRLRYSTFLQPTKTQLERLASRAGRRFIVATTMMKFIDDRHNDPRDRLELMLELTSQLLPGTEVYKLYDLILSTCADPTLAYMHLSVVAVLADPLPISQISELLGPGQGRDVEKVLVQLRSVIDLPTDSSLPVNIYHSSVRDYVSQRSNCCLRQVRNITSPHSLIALSSLNLMVREIPKSTALLDALSELIKHSQAIQPQDPQHLKQSLSFIVQPPDPMQVLIALLWLRGDYNSELQFWLESLDGRAWLRSTGVKDWLLTQKGTNWLLTERGKEWLQTQGGRDWLSTEAGRDWLQTDAGNDWRQTDGQKWWFQTQVRQDWLSTKAGRDWLQTDAGQDWLQTENVQKWLNWIYGGRDWLETVAGRDWLQTDAGKDWLVTDTGGHEWLWSQGGRDWLKTEAGKDWLQTEAGKDWLQTEAGKDWLQTEAGKDWLQTDGQEWWLQTGGGQDWLETEAGRDWLQTDAGRDWLQMDAGKDWLLDDAGGNEWLWTKGGQDWLETEAGKDWQQTNGQKWWLQTQGGQDWLETEAGRDGLQANAGKDWLQTGAGKDRLLTSASGKGWSLTQGRRDWLETEVGKVWRQTDGQKWWFQIQVGQGWLSTEAGRDWLQTDAGRDWLQTENGQEWLDWTYGGRDWLKTVAGRDWLQMDAGKNWLVTDTGGHEWLRTQGGRDWLETEAGKDWLETDGQQWWLQTQGGRDWLSTEAGRDWLQTDAGRDWLQTENGQEWLVCTHGRDWLQTQSGQDWLQNQDGRDWLQTPRGKAWRLNTVWVTMEEFWGTFKAIRDCMISPVLSLHPAFQVIQQFKALPDFLMFPVFLALRHQGYSTTLAAPPDMEIIHAMKAFSSFAGRARKQSQSASGALNYACQNWAVHLSRTPKPWDERLSHMFQSFWHHNLVSWLERQWCLKDLPSCLTILSDGEKLAKEHLLRSGS
ncbi:hypothetical protein EDD22DRAFT_152249 [Suillus occidentalis]|nr:hypothetical protein EDD22DRAFT_152249 [Suillus occidentalis]